MKLCRISKMLKRTSLSAMAVLFAASCAGSPRQTTQKIELIDDPKDMREQEAVNVYEQFPYLDNRGSRL